MKMAACYSGYGNQNNKIDNYTEEDGDGNNTNHKDREDDHNNGKVDDHTDENDITNINDRYNIKDDVRTRCRQLEER